MATLFLSVYLPKRSYIRHTMSDINLNGKTVAELKNDVESLLTYPQNELGNISNTRCTQKNGELIECLLSFE